MSSHVAALEASELETSVLGRLFASERARSLSWRLAASAISAVIALSTARGLRRGYQSISDNALLEIRGRDVLTSNHPWLGTWSSASLSSGIDLNHPGPLLFDVMALPIRLFGGPPGVAVAIATLNIVVVWLVGWVTFRLGGATAALTALAVTAGVVWTLGSELLYDPWQPNVLILPFWLTLCAVWAVASDDVAVLPLAVGAGSFVLQTHLGYAFFVPILVLFALVTVVLSRRPRGPGRFGDLRRPVRNSIIVIAVLWAQPIREQLFGDGEGNLSRLVRAAGGPAPDADATRTGLSLGLRQLGAVLALPPWWGRSGFNTSIPQSTWIETPAGRVLSAPGLRTLTPSLIGLTFVVGLILLGWWSARSSGPAYVVAGYRTLAVALTTAAITLVITPIDVLGLSAHKARWLWVIAAFTTCLLVLALLGRLGEEHRRVALGAAGVLGSIALIATIPTYFNPAGPVAFSITAPAIGELRSQVEDYFESVDGAPDAVLFDADGIGFGEPYTSPVMAQIVADGVELFVDDPALARQLGDGRRAPAGAVLPRVYVRVGAEALEVPDGAERIAFHDGEPTRYSLHDVTDRAVGVFIAPAAQPTDGSAAPPSEGL